MARAHADRPGKASAKGVHPGKRGPAHRTARIAGMKAHPSAWTPRRIVLLALLVVPIAMIVLLFRQPPAGDSWLEIAFYALGVPIAVLNLWAWASFRVLDQPAGPAPARSSPGKKKD